MSKISEISKKYKAEIESAKTAEFNTRYGKHYAETVQPHLKSLDEEYNKLLTQTKQKLDQEKAQYVEEQRQAILAQVEAEFSSVAAAIDPFIEKEV